MRKIRFPLGFTLVELLVTVSILTMLALIGIPMFLNTQRAGRDAKRQTDLSAIRSALENYHADQNYYPGSLGEPGTPISKDGHIYLERIPAEPQSDGSPYCYKPSPPDCIAEAKCTGYKIFARLENRAEGNDSCGTINTYNYVITPQGDVELPDE